MRKSCMFYKMNFNSFHILLVYIIFSNATLFAQTAPDNSTATSGDTSTNTATQTGRAETEKKETTDSESDLTKNDTDHPAIKPWYKRLVFSFGLSAVAFFEDYNFDSAPTPLLTTPSISLALPSTNKMFRITGETSIDVYGTNYKWAHDLKVAIPAEIENRSASVIGIVWGLKAQGSFNYNLFKLRLSAGICFDFRIITIAADLNDAFDMEGEHGAINETNKIKDYFWSKANWLYFEFGIGFDFLITQKYAIGIDAKLYLPPTPPDIAKNIFLGGARMGLGMRVTIF